MSQSNTTNSNFPQSSFTFPNPYPHSSHQPLPNHGPYQIWSPHPSGPGPGPGPGSGSRSVSARNPVPSPSPSTQTAKSTPHPHPGTSNFKPRLSLQSDGPIDPRLSSAFPGALQPGQTDHIQRFLVDGPWSSQSLRTNGNPPNGFLHPPNYTIPIQPSLSEIDGTDSGYQTNPPAYSVIGSDPGPSTRFGYSPDVNHFYSAQGSSTSSETTSMRRSSSNYHPGTPSVVSVPSTTHSTGRGNQTRSQIRCHLCGEMSKCKSDHKKHMLRHNKPWKCDYPNCRRAGKGFGTSNDLDRHRKSVHRIGALQNSWKCASENCRNKEKIWPRLDNFKQHIHRMHPEEHQPDLIRRSTYHAPMPDMTGQALRAPSLDLIGIGEEKQYNSNDFDEPASGISLTSDQESNLWNSFDPSSVPDLAVGAGGSVLMPRGDASSSSLSRERQSAAMLLLPSNKPFYHGRSLSIDSMDSADNVSPKNTFQSLRDLADMASRPTPVNSQPPRKHYRLSNAPQTKSEQMIQRVSKILVRSMRTNNQGGASKDLNNNTKNKKITPRQTKSTSTSSRESSQEVVSADEFASITNTHEDMEGDCITDRECLEVSQVLSDLLIKKKKPPRFRSRTSSTSASNAHKCNYADCDSSFARPCELRKHMKRHTKPYGCTFPRCNKRFGSKSDWKRHEKDQHFQTECYICQAPRSPGVGTGKKHSFNDSDNGNNNNSNNNNDEKNDDNDDTAPRCSVVFAKDHQLRSHIETAHAHLSLSSEAIQSTLKASRVGRNYLGTFYCGFCRRVKLLAEKRNKGWAERFDHIDEHFKERKIEEWVCYEGGVAKGEEGKGREEDEDADEDAEGEEESEGDGDVNVGEEKRDDALLKPDITYSTPFPSVPGTAAAPPPPPPPPPPPLPLPTILPVTIDSKHNARKRHTSESDDFSSPPSHSPSNPNSQPSPTLYQTRKRTKMKYFNYCCECQYGPLQPGTHINCLYCHHRMCHGCDVRAENVAVEEWGPVFSFEG